MRPDHEHESREYTSNMSANSRGIYESDPSLRTGFHVACGLLRFEPGSRQRGGAPWLC
jgi:hypothetical protein